MTGSDQEAIGRIDERTILIAERLENMMDHIDKLNKTMYVGNGTESVMVRLSKLEQHLATFATTCAECKATILANKPPQDESLVEQLVRQQGDVLRADSEMKKTEVEIKKAEVAKETLITSKRWEFWLLIGGAFASIAGSILEMATRKP